MIQDDWYLKPDSLLNMINKMEHNKQCLDLEWKCPGRRGPSPIPLNSHQPDHELSDYKYFYLINLFIYCH